MIFRITAERCGHRPQGAGDDAELTVFAATFSEDWKHQISYGRSSAEPVDGLQASCYTAGPRRGKYSFDSLSPWTKEPSTARAATIQHCSSVQLDVEDGWITNVNADFFSVGFSVNSWNGSAFPRDTNRVKITLIAGS
jgi:hypothetical protein